MRMRSSSKGQAEARSLTHMAKLDISVRSVMWVRVFPESQAFQTVTECYTKRRVILTNDTTQISLIIVFL